MTEQQIIEQLNKLSQIKPKEEWVSLLKSQILNPKPKSTFILNFFFEPLVQKRLAYSFAVLLIIFAGFLGIGQLQLALAPKEDESSKYNFELANKKLEELAVEAIGNSTRSKTAVINEFRASLADTAKNLIESARKNPMTANEIATEARKIKENAVLLDKIGGSDIVANSSGEMYKAIVEEEIKSMENATLTEEQANQLTAIKELFDQAKYSDAFEKILTINN